MLSSEKCPNVLQVTSREGMLQRLKESEVCTRLSFYHVNAFDTIVIVLPVNVFHRSFYVFNVVLFWGFRGFTSY
jgi:hypothetical protein